MPVMTSAPVQSQEDASTREAADKGFDAGSS